MMERAWGISELNGKRNWASGAALLLTVVTIVAWPAQSIAAQRNSAQPAQGSSLQASSPSSQTSSQASAEYKRDPLALVRKAVNNEIQATSPNDHFQFRGRKTTPKGTTTKIFIETSEATAGLMVAIDGKPLTPEQRASEEARVDRFLRDPNEIKKKRQEEKSDQEHTVRIMKALPDAFIYEYVGEQPGTQGIGRTGEPLVKFKFHPNPNYHPPSHVEEVLTGMQGDLLVDAVHERIASIDGILFKDVGFGWGILGKLDRGGHFLVHQENVMDNVWEVSTMTLKFTGKILMLKGFSIDSTDLYDEFKRVPTNLTFAQAVAMLKKEHSEVQESSLTNGGGQK